MYHLSFDWITLFKYYCSIVVRNCYCNTECCKGFPIGAIVSLLAYLFFFSVRMRIKPAQRGYFRSTIKSHEDTAVAGRVEKGMMGYRHDSGTQLQVCSMTA